MALQYEALLNPLVILLTVPLALTGRGARAQLSSTPLARRCCSASSCSPASW
jgi:multidrug efflux pump subunit AcrB